MKRALTLAHLSFLDQTPSDLLRIAAHAQIDAVSLRLSTPAVGQTCYPLQAGSPELQQVRSLADDLGVGIAEVEVACIAADTDVRDYQSVLDAGAALGARRLCVNVDDPLRERAIENCARLCDLAAPLGIVVDVEFMVWRPVRDFLDAVSFVTSVDRRNVSVLVDALHLQRSGSYPGQIVGHAAARVGNVQLCDAPLQAPPSDGVIAEARGDRLLPGEGRLPLAELIARLPADMPLGIEIPTRRYALGMDARELAVQAVGSVRRLLNEMPQA